MNKGILYICPTPIGNLEDITLRVLRVLKEVDLIACEDTRVTQKLLNHYNISTKLTSYHKFSEKQKSEYLINLLLEGKSIALVSDAGTPVISDPGFELVKQAHKNNIKVEPLPGASAVMTAFSASGLDSPYFTFVGFLPRSRKEKETLVSKYKEVNIIFFEAPTRFVKTLEELKEILGNVNLVVTRELTKIYEEIRRDTIENQINYYTAKPPKGEITAIIEGIEEKTTMDERLIIEKIKILKTAGYPTKEISRILSLLTSCPKGKIYDLAVEMIEKSK
ncbi:MAG: 16S rRNA (cytidine(1402)-2'-O)-methyltransferase [Candidatus Gastranaerophilales bacterium]|nr:16S rRNA (cytidine(1402)-2'-O)-methyltransferase [Candidatus Gastranaerophilales bacterium]